MLTLKNVRVEVASFGTLSVREAGERVLVRLEALCAGQGDATEITRAHLEQIARSATGSDELLVISELCRVGNMEPWRPERRSSDETPVFERTRRISDLIASTLGKGSHEQR